MAPTYLPHVLLQMSGRLGTAGGPELWSCGIRLHAPASVVPTRAQLVTALAAMQPLVADWFSGSDTAIASNGFLTTLKLNAINAAGKQPEQDTVELDYGTPPAGARPAVVPFYQSWALTWRTAVRRGRGAAGRIYPPVVSAAMAADGYCTTVAANGMAAAGALLLSNVNQQLSLAAGSQFRAAVMSAGNDGQGGVPVVVPTFNTITGVVVDRVPDVQHRRTRQLVRSESNRVTVSGG